MKLCFIRVCFFISQSRLLSKSLLKVALDLLHEQHYSTYNKSLCFKLCFHIEFDFLLCSLDSSVEGHSSRILNIKTVFIRDIGTEKYQYHCNLDSPPDDEALRKDCKYVPKIFLGLYRLYISLRIIRTSILMHIKKKQIINSEHLSKGLEVLVG
ncbi:hypothetical protein C0J52_09723 [Blattella germanica]|nr:hypothetical protein C0J52_09723 [Blattella germanica]